jgi:hypothetical protein
MRANGCSGFVCEDDNSCWIPEILSNQCLSTWLCFHSILPFHILYSYALSHCAEVMALSPLTPCWLPGLSLGFLIRQYTSTASPEINRHCEFTNYPSLITFTVTNNLCDFHVIRKKTTLVSQLKNRAGAVASALCLLFENMFMKYMFI